MGKFIEGLLIAALTIVFYLVGTIILTGASMYAGMFIGASLEFITGSTLIDSLNVVLGKEFFVQGDLKSIFGAIMAIITFASSAPMIAKVNITGDK